MTRIQTLFAAMTCLFGAFGVQAGEDTKPPQKPFDDTEFVQKAASGSMHEVALGRIATFSAMTDGVKKLGQMMEMDHSKAFEDLKKAASIAELSIPEAMNEKQQKEVDRFKNYKGTDFDREYVKHMISEHEGDLALFTRASKEAKSPAIKEFATKKLPIIQAHLNAARALLPMN
jgi:putative membrane protein